MYYIIKFITFNRFSIFIIIINLIIIKQVGFIILVNIINFINWINQLAFDMFQLFFINLINNNRFKDIKQLINNMKLINILDIGRKIDSELLFKLYHQRSNKLTCILIISYQSFSDWWNSFSLLSLGLIASRIWLYIILQLSDCWIDRFYLHKENSFSIHQLFHCLQSNLNRFNLKRYSFYINNFLQVYHTVLLASHHNKNRNNLSYQVRHSKLVYCKGSSLVAILFELNSTMLLKHILKFLLNLWMIVVYFKELLAKLYHLEHIFHIISSKSVCFNWFTKSKQLLFLLLFNLHSTVRLLQSFIVWTNFILNLWLQYLLHCSTNLLWYVKTQHCSSALFKCSDYTLQAISRLGLDNMKSLWSSTSK